MAGIERSTESTAARVQASRLLVIRLGALGDVVRTRFAFPALREVYPDAEIDWLVEDRAAVGLEGIVGLDRIVTVRRRDLHWFRPGRSLGASLRVVRELKARRYDLAVDFHGILKSALLAWAAQIPQRLGYAAPFAKEGSGVFYNHRVAPEGDHISRFERNAALVEYLGGRTFDRAPALELPPEAAASLDALPDSYCVIHPGTSPGTIYKRWSAESYAEVAARLAERTRVPSLVTWGPVAGEREYAEVVVEKSAGAARLAPPTQSIAALLELLRGASLFLGGDSGPLHLAALAGLPLVVVFGPTDAVENAPFAGAGLRVMRRDVGCNPCREGCPARTCLSAVTPEDVASAALELLAPA